MKALANVARKFGQIISNVASALRHPLKFLATARAVSEAVNRTVSKGPMSPIEFARSMTATQVSRAKRSARLQAGRVKK